MKREALEFDVVIVGGGPSGLAAACRLMHNALAAGQEISVCLVEKGSEIGAHILSGAIFEPRVLTELFPNWQELGAPLNNPVTEDLVYYFTNDSHRVKVPSFFVPPDSHNKGNYVLSLGKLCRWLGAQAENLGVNLFPGFAAAGILYNEDGSVAGVITGDMGVGHDGKRKTSFTPGYELHAKYTLFAEGCRGHLGKELIARFKLAEHSATQHYGIGLKELWDVNPAKHVPGRVVHTVGWPLGHGPGGPGGGSFLYHMNHHQIALGLIIDLTYRNPYLSPFDEFQRWKRHPLIAKILQGGKRISYGARAVIKGGPQALPKLGFPGGLLIGDDAGFLNMLKIKGSHTAMKSGMMAADTVFAALKAGTLRQDLTPAYQSAYKSSWLSEELRRSRNIGPALHKFGTIFGAAYAFFENRFMGGRVPYTFMDQTPDHAVLKLARNAKPIRYRKPDGVLTFDRLSSVFFSNTHHEEDQPCHLILADPAIPITENLPKFDEPAQRYCPAGVYEVVTEGGKKVFHINAPNCVHCKVCDIKDPAQNITWVVPEGGGGPNYPNM